MGLREILISPDPRLKQKAKPVAEVDASVRKICDDMAETMYEANGVGLAAPQIGVHQNIIVMDCDQREPPEGEPEKPKGRGLFWLIDPVMKLGEGEFTYTEGCLSVPDEYEEITRFGRSASESPARSGERAMDHLQGKLFVDHLSALKRELIRRRMKKLKSQHEAERKGEATAF